MKTYERAFGIDWSGDLANTEPTKMLTIAQQRLSASSRTSTGSRSSLPTADSSSSNNNKHRDESKRVALVRSRCKAQNKALSTWWKIALQTYIKQRMWMRLRQNDEECHLPPRFERVYQPEKLGQFDRVFSRAWETPVRRSHAAQHAEGVEDDDSVDFARVIAVEHVEPDRSIEKPHSSSPTVEIPLRKFVDENSFAPQSESALKSFGQYYEAPMTTTFEYIGQNNAASTQSPPDEYLRYCAPSSKVFGHPQSYRTDRVDEFQKELHDYTLEADDVAGIQEVRFRIQCQSFAAANVD